MYQWGTAYVECHMDPPFCDKKSLLVTADASKQHNLMVVGGHSDNVVDLCGEDNDDTKRQILDDNVDENGNVST